MLVTFSLLQYAYGYRYRAFANMGRWMFQPFRASGLQFQKMMGSGKQFGFIPDWSTYVFLATWNSSEEALRFFESEQWNRYIQGVGKTGTLWLHPYRTHGLWDGHNPFGNGEKPEADFENSPVAVLTRATIRLAALPDFWRHVPQARKRLSSMTSDLLFSIGVGEKPLLQQCTFSVWRDEKAVEEFAYRQSGHREVIRRTRRQRWYTEELFARMKVWQADGVFAEIMTRQKQETPL